MDSVNGLTLLLYLVQVVIVVITAVVLLMENRQPSKTMAWLLVLGFLPVVGVLLFIFFGKDARKEKYINQHSLDLLSRQSMANFAEQTNLEIPEKHIELVRQFSNQKVAMPFAYNDVEVYAEGYDFFAALLKEIRKAKRHIHLVTYIFDDDALGRLVADSLIDMARRGVTVRVIYDDVGCWKVKDRFFARMRAEGVQVHAFMPVRFPALTSKVNYRNHRKICVVDGKVGFVGGMNIALRYIKGEKKRYWRDTHLRIEGGAVCGLQTAFLTDWFFVDQKLVADESCYPKISPLGKNLCLTQIVTSDPTSQWPELMQGFVRILLEAKKYVYIETPYFLPTEPVTFALRASALAGVDVRVVVPRKGDSKMVTWASRSFLEDVIDAGVKFYLYQKGFNHSKLLVCDDNLCSCGSANIDFRSFENNFEANAFIYDKKTVATVKKVFDDDLAHSVMLDMNRFRRRPFFERLWESLLRVIAPLL